MLMLTSPMMQKLLAHNAAFTWNDALQAELDSLKKAMKESIKLSPLDVNKRIFCHTDATLMVGMCYLLLQKKVESDSDLDPKHGYLIISCNANIHLLRQNC